MESGDGKTNTADLILAAAQDVFVEKGYENATTREIAERAGIAKGLMYYHFKNKEEMLHRICLQTAEALVDRMKEAIAANARSDATVKVRVKDTLLHYADIFVTTRDFNKLLFHDMEHLRGEWKQAVIEKQTENVHQLRDFIQGMVAQGELRPFDPTVMTFSLISAVHWLFYWFREDGPLSLEEIIDQIADIYVFGTAPLPAPGAPATVLSAD